jgi:hypothetical protein
MKIRRLQCFVCLLVILASLPAWPQRRERDPLTEKEVDELRETNQEPEKRLPLIVKFARERLDAALAAHNNPKLAAADRANTIHDSLQDFISIYDELGDNLDMYTEQKEDLRKPMKAVVAGDGEFKVKLDQIRQSSSPDEMKTYAFVLTSALEAVNDATTEHHKLQQEQEANARAKKKSRR